MYPSVCSFQYHKHPVNGSAAAQENTEDTEEEKDKGDTGNESQQTSDGTEEAEQEQVQNETGVDQEESEEEEESSQTSTEIHPTYTIQQGDTITRISIKTYGSTEKVREICELNNLSVNDLIYPGQKILLP